MSSSETMSLWPTITSINYGCEFIFHLSVLRFLCRQSDTSVLEETQMATGVTKPIIAYNLLHSMVGHTVGDC